MKFTLATVAAFVGLTIAAPAADLVPRGTSPNPSDVTFQNFNYGGTGCKQGTAHISYTDDRTAFTLIFDEYYASAGKGVPITEGRKACQLNFDVHYPQGWQYSILTMTYKGFADLAKGTSGEQSASYYFTGAASNQITLSTPFKGPYSNDYSIDHHLGVTSTIWSPCGKTAPVNIKSSVRVSSPNGAPAQLTTDSIDGNFKMIYQLQWRPCRA